MRRGTAKRFGFFSMLVLATTAFGSVGGASVSQAGSTMSESHAPRIPIPGPGGIHATTADDPWSSRNWSGYAIDSGTYTSVTGSWTVPTVTGPEHPGRARQFSSTWVGIDGFNNGDLIQAGTEQDWLHGAPFYQSWWEILPNDETPIDTITVNPGDVMTVSLTQGAPDWTITVTDTTNGQTFSTKENYSGPMTSAEWIQEAPTVKGRIAPLADDGTFEFDNATANGVSPGFTSSDSGVMVKRRGRDVISIPSTPNPAGNAFAVAFGSVPPLPPD